MSFTLKYNFIVNKMECFTTYKFCLFTMFCYINSEE